MQLTKEHFETQFAMIDQMQKPQKGSVWEVIQCLLCLDREMRTPVEKLLKASCFSSLNRAKCKELFSSLLPTEISCQRVIDEIEARKALQEQSEEFLLTGDYNKPIQSYEQQSIEFYNTEAKTEESFYNNESESIPKGQSSGEDKLYNVFYDAPSQQHWYRKYKD